MSSQDVGGFSHLFPKPRLNQGGGGGGGGGERTLTYAKAANVPRIDARAVRRDMDGNVISSPAERGFKNLHRDMGGNPISGTDLSTGLTVNFPKPSIASQTAPQHGGAAEQPVTGASESGAGRFHAIAAGGDAGKGAASAMESGNSRVHFQGAQERGNEMAERNNDRVDAVGDAVGSRAGAPQASPTGFPQSPGVQHNDLAGGVGYTATRDNGTRTFGDSRYGSGDSHFPKPAEMAGVHSYVGDETGDRSAGFTGRGSHYVGDDTGDRTAEFSPTMQRAERQVADDTKAAQPNADAAPAAAAADQRVAQANADAAPGTVAADTRSAQGNVGVGDRQVLDNTKAAEGNIDVGNRSAAANDAAAQGLPVNDAAAGTGFPKPANIGGTDVAGGPATIPGLPDNGFPKPGGDAQTDLGPGVPLESYTMPNGKVGRRPAAQPAGGYAAAAPGGDDE